MQDRFIENMNIGKWSLVKNFMLVRKVKTNFDFGHSGCPQGPIRTKKRFGQLFLNFFFGSHNVLRPPLQHIKNLRHCKYLQYMFVFVPSQCLRMDLNKRSGGKPKTTAGSNRTP